MPWGWVWYWWKPWPGNGPFSWLPPWLRPGWLFGRGSCWWLFGGPWGYYAWLRNYYPYYYPWWAYWWDW